MSETVLTLLLLSVPGLIFRYSYGVMIRLRQRHERDLLSAISFLIPISLLLLLGSYLLLMLPCFGGMFCNSTGAIVEDALINIDKGIRLSAFLPLLLIATALAYLLGAIFGKIRTWRTTPGKRGRLPLEALTGGIFPPVILATVLTTTKVNDKLLIYAGSLEAIQIGPEGKIDYVVISGQIKKSLMLDDTRQEGNVIQNGFPATRKPFQRIAEPGIREEGQNVTAERLIIESEDIANIHIEVIERLGNGDMLDRLFYGIARKVNLIQESAPTAPRSQKR